MKKSFFKNIDYLILIIPIILSTIGIISIYSADKPLGLIEFSKQIKWLLISIPFLIISAGIDYKKLGNISLVGYIILILSLIGVLFTKEISGARSWFQLDSFSLQPSEFGKVLTIIFLGNLVSKIQSRDEKEINKFSKLLGVLILGAIPVILTAMQPDYGTALAYVFILITILFLANLDYKYILLGIVLGFLILIPIFTKILPKYAPHALKRFEIFLNPEKDPLGDGYNTIQSKIAVGSGGIFGMGLHEGTQTQLGFLHPKTTDFIFSVISEEMGFIISSLIILMYTIYISRIIYISKTAKDKLGTYIAGAIAILTLYHVAQNIGMTMGIMPITGIPLPFLSYGGSSTITNYIFVGILINISGRRKRAIMEER